MAEQKRQEEIVTSSEAVVSCRETSEVGDSRGDGNDMAEDCAVSSSTSAKSVGEARIKFK